MLLIHTSINLDMHYIGRQACKADKLDHWDSHVGGQGRLVGTSASMHSIGDPIGNGRDFVETGR